MTGRYTIGSAFSTSNSAYGSVLSSSYRSPGVGGSSRWSSDLRTTSARPQFRSRYSSPSNSYRSSSVLSPSTLSTASRSSELSPTSSSSSLTSRHTANGHGSSTTTATTRTRPTTNGKASSTAVASSADKKAKAAATSAAAKIDAKLAEERRQRLQRAVLGFDAMAITARATHAREQQKADRITVLEDRIQGIQAERAKLEGKVQELEAELKELGAAKASAEQEFRVQREKERKEVADAHEEEAKKASAAHEKEVQRVREELAQDRQKALQEKDEEAKTQHKKNEEKIKELKDEQEAKIRERARQISNLEAERTELNDKIERLTAELKELSDSLRKDSDSKIQKRKKAQFQHLVKDRDSYKEINEMLTDQLRELRTQNAKLMTKVDEIPRLESMIQKLRLEKEDLDLQVQRKREVERAMRDQMQNLMETSMKNEEMSQSLMMENEQLQYQLSEERSPRVRSSFSESDGQDDASSSHSRSVPPAMTRSVCEHTSNTLPRGAANRTSRTKSGPKKLAFDEEGRHEDSSSLNGANIDKSNRGSGRRRVTSPMKATVIGGKTRKLQAQTSGSPPPLPEEDSSPPTDPLASEDSEAADESVAIRGSQCAGIMDSGLGSDFTTSTDGDFSSSATRPSHDGLASD